MKSEISEIQCASVLVFQCASNLDNGFTLGGLF